MFFHKRKALEIRQVPFMAFAIILGSQLPIASTPTGNDSKVSELLDEKVAQNVVPISCSASFMLPRLTIHR